jgi:Ras-related protein Rab-18
MNNRNSNVSIKSTDSKRFYKLKLILIGDSGVGKTSLLNRYMGEQFIPNQPCTINADFKIKSIRIDELTFAEIIIWDTCGQERYRSMTRQYFQDAHGIILVYDVCDKRSFADLNIWLEEIKKNSIKENISIILCGNKIDLKFRNTSFEEASTFAKNNDILYCETSSKEGFNIETAFEKLIKDIIEKMNRNSQFDTETRKSASLRESTKAVSGKERKREKEVKCC